MTRREEGTVASSLQMTYVPPGPAPTFVHGKVIQHMLETLGSGFVLVVPSWKLLEPVRAQLLGHGMLHKRTSFLLNSE